jgi:CheY-like chemotaxis protein
MVRPVLMAVDDEPAALRAIEGELGKRYGADYEVVCADTPEVGLRRLERLKVDAEQLALVLADQWMPSMTGVAFLGHARRLHPGAQRVLLTNWGDRSTGGIARPPSRSCRPRPLAGLTTGRPSPGGRGMSSSSRRSAGS